MRCIWRNQPQLYQRGGCGQAPSIRAARGRGRCFLLLIAAGTEAQEIAYNTLFAGALGSRAELWAAPGAAHTGAYTLLPAEWEASVLGFYDDVLR